MGERLSERPRASLPDPVVPELEFREKRSDADAQERRQLLHTLVGDGVAAQDQHAQPRGDRQHEITDQIHRLSPVVLSARQPGVLLQPDLVGALELLAQVGGGRRLDDRAAWQAFERARLQHL
eukprot:430705-Rhodomonas_salina.1